jgi:hypothetical protein
MEAFVYCWTDHLTGKLAAGKRWSTDVDLKQAQSVRIKQWWADRKEQASVGQ